MKKAFFSILLVTALAAPTIFARQNQGTPPDPSTFVARRVQYLTTLLDLNPSQVQTATTALTTAATANASLRSQLRTAHEALKADVQGGSGNVATDAATIASLEGQILANDAAAEKTLWAILSTSQQDKLKALGPGGFGGRGPRGPAGSWKDKPGK
jgi:hypothetical protein